MCTLSWTGGNGFRIYLFNRDEKRSRPTETAPGIFTPPERPRLIAPLDPQGGGTWIAVNEYGLTAALLNWYGADTAPSASPRRSRGDLPREAVANRRFEDALAWANDDLDPSAYPAFLLFFGDGDGRRSLILWDGKGGLTTDLGDIEPPVTTSSWRPLETETARRDLYHALTGPEPLLSELLAFHSHHDPERPALGPAMVRDDASTRSLTIVRISPTDVSMRHQVFDRDHLCFLEPSEHRLPRRLSG